MIVEFTLKRCERLRGKKELEELFVTGRKSYSGPLRFFWLTNPMSDENHCLPSVLFSVPKKFLKRANKRNLIKRRMREAYRLNKSSFVLFMMEHKLNAKLAFIYNTSEVVDYRTIERGIKVALDKISKNS